MDKVTQDFPSARQGLKGVCLCVQEGQPLLIQGEPGSGKTLLLETLCGKRIPGGGKVTVDGRDWRLMSELKRGRLCRELFGMVRPGRVFMESLTLEENLLLPLDFAGGGRTAAKRRAWAAAERAGVLGLLGQYPERLPPAARYRARLARALLLSPRFLLLDGWPPDLSEEERRSIRELLDRWEQQGLATCVRTAGLGEASRPGEEVFLLRRGRLQRRDTGIRPAGGLACQPARGIRAIL